MFKQENNCLFFRFDKEQLQIEPWGRDSLRIRATQGMAILPDEDFALLPTETPQADIRITDKGARITNGLIRCDVSVFGVMSFFYRDKLILKEYDRNRYNKDEADFCSALEIMPRMYASHIGTENYKITVRFEPNEDEKLFGMGQYQQNELNLKGCILELAHRNSQISVPFVLSNKHYGLLWNNPAIGRVTFGNNLTEWVSESTRQIDYWVTVGDRPADIEENYSLVTGRAPMMPDFALGFWQSKLRYQTQEELLEVAREYHRRKIPVSVIVADFFHWKYQGDWSFDKTYWPDPKAMVEELEQMGMKLMVSIWPTMERKSCHFQETRELGYLVRSERGSRMSHLGETSYVDMTHPEARKYLWKNIKENYYDQGVRVFWLDEAEPEYTAYEFENYRYAIGSDLEKGNLYPRCYAQMGYEGMQSEGEKEIVNLCRCAWVGSQRYGALVWSGDIDSGFRSMRHQLSAGLNISMAGIPWWTTDIGGFHGGDISDPAFRENLIRWFQFAAFCPVFRLHGFREPHMPPMGTEGGAAMCSGASNEIWSYGEKAQAIMEKYLFLREKMRPHVRVAMKQAHEKGQPVMRTVFYNYPDDERAWQVDDGFFMGDDILVYPILNAGQTTREVYLPKGVKWRDINSGKLYEGGQTYTVDAPLETIPVFIPEGKMTEISFV